MYETIQSIATANIVMSFDMGALSVFYKMKKYTEFLHFVDNKEESDFGVGGVLLFNNTGSNNFLSLKHSYGRNAKDGHNLEVEILDPDGEFELGLLQGWSVNSNIPANINLDLDKIKELRAKSRRLKKGLRDDLVSPLSSDVILGGIELEAWKRDRVNLRGRISSIKTDISDLKKEDFHQSSNFITGGAFYEGGWPFPKSERKKKYEAQLEGAEIELGNTEYYLSIADAEIKTLSIYIKDKESEVARLDKIKFSKEKELEKVSSKTIGLLEKASKPINEFTVNQRVWVTYGIGESLDNWNSPLIYYLYKIEYDYTAEGVRKIRLIMAPDAFSPRASMTDAKILANKTLGPKPPTIAHVTKFGTFVSDDEDAAGHHRRSLKSSILTDAEWLEFKESVWQKRWGTSKEEDDELDIAAGIEPGSLESRSSPYMVKRKAEEHLERERRMKMGLPLHKRYASTKVPSLGFHEVLGATREERRAIVGGYDLKTFNMRYTPADIHSTIVAFFEGFLERVFGTKNILVVLPDLNSMMIAKMKDLRKTLRGTYGTYKKETDSSFIKMVEGGSLFFNRGNIDNRLENLFTMNNAEWREKYGKGNLSPAWEPAGRRRLGHEREATRITPAGFTMRLTEQGLNMENFIIHKKIYEQIGFSICYNTDEAIEDSADVDTQGKFGTTTISTMRELSKSSPGIGIEVKGTNEVIERLIDKIKTGLLSVFNSIPEGSKGLPKNGNINSLDLQVRWESDPRVANKLIEVGLLPPEAENDTFVIFGDINLIDDYVYGGAVYKDRLITALEGSRKNKHVGKLTKDLGETVLGLGLRDIIEDLFDITNKEAFSTPFGDSSDLSVDVGFELDRGAKLTFARASDTKSIVSGEESRKLLRKLNIPVFKSGVKNSNVLKVMIDNNLFYWSGLQDGIIKDLRLLSTTNFFVNKKKIDISNINTLLENVEDEDALKRLLDAYLADGEFILKLNSVFTRVTGKDYFSDSPGKYADLLYHNKNEPVTDYSEKTGVYKVLKKMILGIRNNVSARKGRYKLPASAKNINWLDMQYNLLDSAQKNALIGSIETVPSFYLSHFNIINKPCFLYSVEPKISGVNSDFNPLSVWYSGVYNFLGFEHTINYNSLTSKFNIIRPQLAGMNKVE